MTVPLSRIGRLQCHAIIGEVTTDSEMCGEPVHKKSFCKAHYNMYYQPTPLRPISIRQFRAMEAFKADPNIKKRR